MLARLAAAVRTAHRYDEAERALAVACAKPADERCAFIVAEKCPERELYAEVCPKLCGKCPNTTAGE